MQAIHRSVLKEHLVVFGNGDEKDERGDILKAVDPFFPLRPLSSHIQHAVREIADNKRRLCDAGCLDARSKHILVARNVVRLTDTEDRVKVTARRRDIYELRTLFFTVFLVLLTTVPSH